MLNITNIPAPRVPFIDDRTGLMSREWYRFFLNLFVLTGSGGSDATITDLLIAPQSQDLSGDFVDTATQSQLASLMARYGNLEDLIQGAYLAPVVQTGTLGAQDASNVTVGTLNATTVNAGTLTVYQTGTTTAQETIRNDTVTLVNNAAASTAVAGTTTNHDYYLYANNTVQAVASKDGGMFIGCTATPSSTVSGIRWNNALATGAAKVSAGSVTTTTYLIEFINGNGIVGNINTNGTATAYTTSSDYRLKTNVKPMQGALDKIDALSPVTFDWVTDGLPSQGFIAHELQAVVPECVVGEKDAVDDQGDPIYQSIDTSFLVATLTAAIKELKSEVDALKRKI